MKLFLELETFREFIEKRTKEMHFRAVVTYDDWWTLLIVLSIN
jgi:hypothetical protein